MIARALRAIAALCLALPVAAAAQDRAMQTVWMIQPAEPPAGERVLAGGDVVLKQRLLPTGLAELRETSPALSGTVLAAGAQLVEVTTAGARVFCTPQVARQKLIGASFQPCLVDEDSDGDFDGWFNAISQTKGLLSVGGSRPRRIKAIAPTPYAVADPTTMRDIYFVAIERRNYFNIYNLETFMIAFGRDGEVDRITTPIAIKAAELPKPVTVLGARFTALAEAEGKMTVRIEQSMPAQPFGVVKTVSYNFY